MSKYLYEAFGFIIDSEFPIAQIPLRKRSGSPDIIIKYSALSELPPTGDDFYFFDDQEASFDIAELAKFRITNGNCIEVSPIAEYNASRLGVYLMGSCMGAIIHQRGLFPLHGSCVTNGEYAILITGDSGAGKSTLAAEFLSHGWKLATDDVAVVKNIESEPLVQSSYPSQKLWQDSLEQYNHKEEEVHSLYFDEHREKFGVNVSEYFAEGVYPLKLVIRLAFSEDYPTQIQPINDMAKVNQLMINTYRTFMIPAEKKQDHFRRCVALANKVQMAFVLRKQGESTAAKLYEMILKYQ